MGMRTALGKVRGLGSAKEGTEHFWRQRLTAVANIPLVIVGLWLVVSLVGAPYPEVRARLASPLTAIFIALFSISVLYHMRLGMQVVIEDYIHSELRKIALIMLNTFFVFFSGALVAFAVFKLAFGG
ncbi:succinate dehydrogenase, hydrophobic membrane anchor protein [Salaquimonas pukyongi]|uniref:succinate dehydrogenase, hydrophobic membrane anchor protein n=1 Tax=Salaquimonas pukyongi TaxID=2712698 RepID=UPI00096BC977|nr:succinate dehydrogenase, hydrophobic membrane anchor protein [Salaquimonas pukyongi]